MSSRWAAARTSASSSAIRRACRFGGSRAAGGVGIRRWTTWHGFALNVSTDLRFFDSIVPCGIKGCRMTSICELTNRAVSVSEFAEVMRESFRRVFHYDGIVLAGPSQPGQAPQLMAGDG